jgi:hypothetical protein
VLPEVPQPDEAFNPETWKTFEAVMGRFDGAKEDVVKAVKTVPPPKAADPNDVAGLERLFARMNTEPQVVWLNGVLAEPQKHQSVRVEFSNAMGRVPFVTKIDVARRMVTLTVNRKFTTALDPTFTATDLDVARLVFIREATLAMALADGDIMRSYALCATDANPPKECFAMLEESHAIPALTQWVYANREKQAGIFPASISRDAVMYQLMGARSGDVLAIYGESLKSQTSEEWVHGFEAYLREGAESFGAQQQALKTYLYRGNMPNFAWTQREPYAMRIAERSIYDQVLRAIYGQLLSGGRRASE